MEFSNAVDEFQRFLRANGHEGPLLWITPTDLMLSDRALFIRPRTEAAAESEELFQKAAVRGVGVSLEAIARLDQYLCCYVFAPESAEEAAAQFVAPPVTMKVRQDLKDATRPGLLRWWLARRMASKRTMIRSLQFFGHELEQGKLITRRTNPGSASYS